MCKNKVATMVNLISRGVVLPDSGLCVLCGTEPETSSHLFMHFSVSWGLWAAIMNREGLCWVIPGSLESLAAEWDSLAAISDAVLWNLSPYALVWTLWLCRNEKQFNNKPFSAPAAWDAHLVKISWWTKNVWKDCPYDSSHFLANFTNISVCKAIKPPRVAVWSPPPSGLLKFNVDGASPGNPGPSGIGGVIHNHANVLIGYFSMSIGFAWAFEAEVKAILNALQFCQQFMLHNVLLESDSSLAIGWVLSPSRRPSTLLNDLNHIDYLMSIVGCVGIQHTFREGNEKADKLAKDGCSRVENLWVCFDPPFNS